MIATKRYDSFQFDSFLTLLGEKLAERGINVIGEKKVIDAVLPKITVLTVEKGGKPFRISVVYDKNGITATAVGLTEENLKKEVEEIFNTISL
ncbi:MAG: hypothetical protein GXN94_03650 [Aquificae bacterium]|nr:hypothetical protein [Aquificota bacterium]